MDGKGTGSYSHSQGHPWFREDIANFLKERDGGVEASADNIFMTNGASKGIEMVLETLLADESKGLMLPIPQYPIYSAQVALRGAHQVGYYLDEEKGWSINIDHLEKELEKAKQKGIEVVGFVLINPGNPTGQVMSREALHASSTFAKRQTRIMSVLTKLVYLTFAILYIIHLHFVSVTIWLFSVMKFTKIIFMTMTRNLLAQNALPMRWGLSTKMPLNWHHSTLPARDFMVNADIAVAM